MTPEQRETRPATTDAMLAQKVERLHQFIYSVSGSGESEAHATIREVLALLAHRAALAPAPACGTWQTIATAPRVGEVLLWWPHWSHRAMVGYWKFSKWIGENALSDTEHDPGPTHWMPLPDPPTEPTR